MYATIESLLQAKEAYVVEDENASYIEKTRKDIEIIKEFQKQFPLIYYKVSDNGVLYKMYSTGKINDQYVFSEISMMACQPWEDWKVKDAEIDELCWYGQVYMDIPTLLSAGGTQDLEEAKKISQQRWTEVNKPHGMYRIARYFDVV